MSVAKRSSFLLDVRLHGMHVALVSVVDQGVAEDIARLLEDHGYSVKLHEDGVIKVREMPKPKKPSWWKRLVR